jgi:hypothetical protein
VSQINNEYTVGGKTFLKKISMIEIPIKFSDDNAKDPWTVVRYSFVPEGLLGREGGGPGRTARAGLSANCQELTVVLDNSSAAAKENLAVKKVRSHFHSIFQFPFANQLAVVVRGRRISSC